MKQLFIILTCFLLMSFSFGQTEPAVYKVKFTDKGISAYSISRPAEFLSLKSIERRLAQQIPLTETDLPINPDYLEMIESAGAEIIYTSKWLNIAIIRVPDPTILDKISKNEFIREIIPADYLFQKQVSSKMKPYFESENIKKLSPDIKKSHLKNGQSLDYGFSLNQAQMIAIDQLHSLGFTGNGMTIAVIDAGFNSANVLEAFDSLRSNGQILGTRDFVVPGNDVYNSTISAHGMMVLSTMGGNLPGLLIGTAPKASYWLLRSEDALAEYLMEEYYWVNAAEYADSIGVDIINSSLGYTEFDNPDENHTYDDLDGNTAIVTIGADIAASKGILVVNSAGNSGGSEWLYLGAPADGDSVFTIGAVDPEGIYASFSSIGPTSDGRIKPDVTAQGVNTIVATIPSGVAGGSGTSFSSPVIAGASACLWQANPTFTNMEVLNAIKMSGSQSSSPDNYKGWGIPNFILASSLLTSSIQKQTDPLIGLNAYPIPFNGKINIEVVASINLMVDIEIINSIGNSLAVMEGIQLNKGKNLIVFNKLERLPKGIYMLQISDGYYVITEKIVK